MVEKKRRLGPVQLRNIGPKENCRTKTEKSLPDRSSKNLNRSRTGAKISREVKKEGK